MSVKEDKVNLTITIDGDQGKKELGQLDEKAAALTAEIKRLKAAHEDYTAQADQLTDVKARMSELRAEIGLTALTQKQLRQELQNLNAQWSNMTPGTEAYKLLGERINQVKDRITELKTNQSGVTQAIERTTEAGKEFGKVLLAGFGVEKLAEGFKETIKKSGEMSDQMVELREKTGMTQAEVDAFVVTLKKIDTRTPVEQLMGIAIAAGKIGISKEDLAAFTQQADKVSLALGKEMGANAEEITAKIGKLRNVFVDIRTNKPQDDITHIANALLELQNHSQASSESISELSMKMAPVATRLGFTSAQVVGLSATLNSMGIDGGRAGQAITRMFDKMATKSQSFAQVAGMPIKQFTELLNKDAYQAFQKVIEGANASGPAATQLAAAMKDLGVDTGITSTVFAALGANTQMLQTNVERATEAIHSDAAITESFNLKNSTLGALMEKLKKGFEEFAISPGVIGFLRGAIVGVQSFFRALVGLPKLITDNKEAFTALAGITGIYYANTIRAALATVANTTAELAATVARKAKAAWTGIAAAAESGYSTIVGVLTGKIALATIAQAAWNVVMMLNPVGLIIGAIGAAAVAVELYSNNTKEALQLEKDKYLLDKDLNEEVRSGKELLNDYNDRLQHFNELSVDEKNAIVNSIKVMKEKREEELKALQLKSQQVAAEEGHATILQKIGNYFKAAGNVSETVMSNVETATKNSKEALDQYTPALKELDGQIKDLAHDYDDGYKRLHAYDEAMKINIETTSGLEERIALLQTAVKNAKVGSEEYIKAQAALAVAQQLLGNASGVVSDKLKKQWEEVVTSLKKLNEEYTISYVSDFTKGIKQIEDKFKDLREKSAGNAALLKQINKDEADAIYTYKLKMQEKLVDELNKLHDKEYKASLTDSEKEQELAWEEYATAIKAAQESGKSTIAIEQERDEKILAIREKYHQTELQKEAEFDQKVFEYGLSAEQKEIVAAQKEAEKLLENKKITAAQEVTIKENLEKNLAAIHEKYATKEEKRDTAQAKAYLDLESKTYAGLTNILSAYQATLTKGSAEAKHLAQIQKQMSVGQAIIKAYLAINETLADPKLIATQTNVVAAVALGVEAFANVAAIEATPVAFAQGGIVDKPTFSITGEDGPEAIIPLSKGARGTDLWQQAGKRLGLLNEAPQMVNMKAIQTAYGTSNNNRGSVSDTYQSQQANGITPQAQSGVFTQQGHEGKSQANYDLHAQIKRLNDHLDKGLQSYQNYDATNRDNTLIGKIQQLAKLGK